MDLDSASILKGEISKKKKELANFKGSAAMHWEIPATWIRKHRRNTATAVEQESTDEENLSDNSEDDIRPPLAN